MYVILDMHAAPRSGEKFRNFRLRTSKPSLEVKKQNKTGTTMKKIAKDTRITNGLEAMTN